MAHEHNMFDNDRHFIIDPITRTIKNQSGKTTLVKTDHNSEIYTFEMPRYIEGHDMTICNVNEVHYINLGTGKDKGKTSSGLYQIEDLQVYSEDDEKVVFSWTIKGNATKYEGSLQFKIKFKCLNNNAEIEYLWNTLSNKEISVGEDINNTDYVEEMYADVLMQWEQRFLEAGAVDLSSYYTKEEVDQKVSQLEEDKGGLNETASKQLIKVLRNGLYAIDLSEDINTLETQLGANIVSYAITNNLTNATNNNVETSIKEGFSYSASIVATLGYILSNVTVTMGGTDITNEVYSGGVINIPSVSGDIVITAIATISETTMYSITNTFTNVSTDNPNTSVLENSGYVANLTVSDGYLLESVTVTMGGVDITSSAYANGVVTIASVTGNVVITAFASEPQSDEVVLLKSIKGDGASYIDTEVLPQKSHRYEISFTSATDGEGAFVGGTLFGVDCYAYASAYLGVWVKNTTITKVQCALNNSNGVDNGSWFSSENNNLTNKQVYFVMGDGLQAIYLDENYTVRQTHGGDTNGTASWNDRENDIPPYPMYLFYVNYQGGTIPHTIGSHTFYWFKVFDNSTNELLHEFVPAMSGAKIGVYDNVTQKFHENIGTGTFSYEEVEA